MALVSVADAVSAARWSSGVTASVGATTFTLTSNGLPDCGTATNYLVPKPGINVAVPTSLSQVMSIPNPAGAQSYRVTFPLTPTPAAQPQTTGLGMIGLTISGVAIFNPYEADGTTVALDHNLTSGNVGFIDTSNGHPNQDRAYHYHGMPVCLVTRVDVTAGQHSHIVGFLLDGYPVYGPTGDGGGAATGLDQCGGHFGPTPEFPQGIYHYHFSVTTPYSFRCYHGVKS